MGLSCVGAPGPEKSGRIKPDPRSDTHPLLPFCASVLSVQPPPVVYLDFARLLSPWGEREMIPISNTPFSGFWGQTEGVGGASLIPSPSQRLLSSLLSQLLLRAPFFCGPLAASAPARTYPLLSLVNLD